MERRTHDDRIPAWAWVLLGWLGGRTIVAWLPDQEVLAAVRPPAGCTLEAEEPGPPGPTPRELRGVPDVGETRALALARAFWERGGVEFELTEIPGIGPVSSARIRAWLATRGAEPRE